MPRRRTKIVATMGPASDGPERLHDVLSSGVNVCRLNFSHGELSEHHARIENIRAWSRKHGRAIAILGDLCGPKIRISKVPEPIRLKRGDSILLTSGSEPSTRERLRVSLDELLHEIKDGHRVYIDDGRIHLLAVGREGDDIVCTCTTGGEVKSNKGVNLPDTRLSTPALTKKDRVDLAFAIEHDLEYVALSFVQRPADVRELRQIVDEAKSPLHVVAKIERPEALEHLEEIVKLSDAVMVARGDLGVEMDVWRVPLAQKRLITLCRQAGKPVIVATHMLQSMVSSPVPTRAEVSDVANAAFDGADAVMLSEETAVGSFPMYAVETMVRVSTEVEQFLARETQSTIQPTLVITSQPGVGAVVDAAAQAASSIGAKAIVAWTASGETVRLLARLRPPMPILALSADERVYRQLVLLYGVVPIHFPDFEETRQMMELIDAQILERQLASVGDPMIVVTSTRPQVPGQTDTVLVRRISAAAE